MVSLTGQKNSKVALISLGFTSTYNLYILISLGFSIFVKIISPSYTIQTLEVNLTFNHIVVFLLLELLPENIIEFLFLNSGGGSGIEPGATVLGTE